MPHPCSPSPSETFGRWWGSIAVKELRFVARIRTERLDAAAAIRHSGGNSRRWTCKLPALPLFGRLVPCLVPCLLRLLMPRLWVSYTRWYLSTAGVVPSTESTYDCTGGLRRHPTQRKHTGNCGKPTYCHTWSTSPVGYRDSRIPSATSHARRTGESRLRRKHGHVQRL